METWPYPTLGSVKLQWKKNVIHNFLLIVCQNAVLYQFIKFLTEKNYVAGQLREK